LEWSKDTFEGDELRHVNLTLNAVLKTNIQAEAFQRPHLNDVLEQVLLQRVDPFVRLPLLCPLPILPQFLTVSGAERSAAVCTELTRR
jgi:hypothetical protein